MKVNDMLFVWKLTEKQNEIVLLTFYLFANKLRHIIRIGSVYDFL